MTMHNYKICSSSGCKFSTHFEDDNFCGHCGSKLIDMCPKCHSKILDPSIVHCTNCGSNLQTAPESVYEKRGIRTIDY